MREIFPGATETTIERQLEALDPAALDPGDRPYLVTNFVQTLDGQATIEGRSGPIGSDTDTAMLMGLRAAADAVMIGAGTMRVERYGRMLPGEELRRRRAEAGRDPDPLAVIVSASLDLPWEAGLFTSGEGGVVVLTSDEAEAPATETPTELWRRPDGVDLADALGRLRRERGVRLLLCEGGPRLHTELLERGLVDEIFVTIAPRLGAEDAPRIVAGPLGGGVELEPVWILTEESTGEVFCRYRRRDA